MDRRHFCLGASAVALGCATRNASNTPAGIGPNVPSLAIHGGAGTIPRTLPRSVQKAYLAGLDEALRLGVRSLEQGMSSLDAVERVVRTLEDNPLFNAGKGAVYTHDGGHELDAAMMDGRTLACGAVTGLTTVKNPISLARLVMERTRHVFLAGKGAEDFATAVGVERVPNNYFDTETRFRAWQEARRGPPEDGFGAPPSTKKAAPSSRTLPSSELPARGLPARGLPARELPARELPARELPARELPAEALPASEVPADRGYGTVGAVARDVHGNLAAATSTGGLTDKRFGRVGDVPVIGAGTYANNFTCAVSCTGTGEEFIRHNVAHDISSLMEYRGLSLADAAAHVVHKKLKPGDGGLIGVGRDGSIALVFNSAGMYRGAADGHGRFELAIW